ncbi:MAG: ribonuclease P protein component [Sphingomonadaceae bacterium]|nr:ribonuclease P protein component [Sphingomonadaceae bacterium]
MAKRADFLAANRGTRAAMPGFVLLARARADGDATTRLGITITKKIGGAVVRNRMRRRFHEIARMVLPDVGAAGTDYVMIGRAGGIERDFATLKAELARAIEKVAR